MEIELICNHSSKTKHVWVSKLSVILKMLSCSTQKNLDDFAEIDLNNCSSFKQQGNPNFKPVEFDGFKKQPGLNSFVMTPKRWIESTNAIGIVSKAGRYEGTFAHNDIALEFTSWISIEFKLYIIKEFQRLMQLNKVAVTQMKSLVENKSVKKLK